MSDLNKCALRLLNFIEDSVHEAINNPTAAFEPLNEADCTIRLLMKILKQEDEVKCASLSLLPTFDGGTSLLKAAKERPDDLNSTLSDAVQQCGLAKQFFQHI